jgi:hypothetical protein
VKFVFAFMLAACCAGQISPPLIGYVRTSGRELRPVYGVAGAFLTGEAIDRDVLSSSFSVRVGLVKKDHELLVYREQTIVRRHAVPPGPARFGFTAAGEPDWVRYEDGSCALFRDKSLQPDACPVESDGVAREHIGEGWFATHTTNAILLTRECTGEVWTLPEERQ